MKHFQFFTNKSYFLFSIFIVANSYILKQPCHEYTLPIKKTLEHQKLSVAFLLYSTLIGGRYFDETKKKLWNLKINASPIKKNIKSLKECTWFLLKNILSSSSHTRPFPFTSFLFSNVSILSFDRFSCVVRTLFLLFSFSLQYFFYSFLWIMYS